MAHDEFPPLYNAVRNVLAVASTGLDVSKPCLERRFSSALIRAAINQAAPFTCRTTGLQVVVVSDLLAIADNLHALPPPPPTREEMDYALTHLWPLLDCRPGSKGDEYMQILRRGIAHHCKEQP